MAITLSHTKPGSPVSSSDQNLLVCNAVLSLYGPTVTPPLRTPEWLIVEWVIVERVTEELRVVKFLVIADPQWFGNL